jgi:hypothetical protein
MFTSPWRIFWILLWSFRVFPDPLPICNNDFVSKGCEYGDELELPSRRNPTPTPIENPTCPSCLPPEEPVTEEKMKQIPEYFKYVQNELIDELTKGQPPSHLPKGLADLVSRIQSVKPAEPDSRYWAAFCKGGPSAYYEHDSNSVFICPENAYASRISVLGIIAHELGHPIDSCIALADRYKINKTRISSDEGPDRDELVDYLASFRGNSITSSSFIGRTQASIQARTVRKLVESKYLELEQKGIPADEYPFNDVITCLNKQLGFRDGSENAPAQYAKDYFDSHKNSNDVVAQRRCSSKSQLNESIGDVLMTIFLAREIRKNPPKNDKERFAPFSLFSAIACQNRDSAKTRAYQSEHPPTIDRLEKIMLANKDIQKALGCRSNMPDCSKTMSKTFASVTSKSSPSSGQGGGTTY